MKRIATGFLFALAYAKADFLSLSMPVTSPSSIFSVADGKVSTCSGNHCSDINGLLTETCTKNKWEAGHIVMVYNLEVPESCYCTCPSAKSLEAQTIKTFLPADVAYAKSQEKDMFRPMDDEASKQWTLDLLAYHKNFYPEVEFHLDWTNNQVNAVAYHDGGKRHVKLFGGLVRYKGMEKEGLALVLAHELGHHFAGKPTYPGSDMSCEGQADWGGVRDLMRRIWFGEQYIDVARKAIPQMAVLFSAKDDPTIPDLPPSHCNHPQGQCRIGTYYAALSLEHAKPKCAE